MIARRRYGDSRFQMLSDLIEWIGEMAMLLFKRAVNWKRRCRGNDNKRG